jgi:hypothetical protein
VDFDVVPAVMSVEGNDSVRCLQRLIAERCLDPGKKVPRVAHYVRFGQEFEFPLDAFLSAVSVARFLQVMMTTTM